LIMRGVQAEDEEEVPVELPDDDAGQSHAGVCPSLKPKVQVYAALLFVGVPAADMLGCSGFIGDASSISCCCVSCWAWQGYRVTY
jgi:hypothetical protein